MRVAVTGATGFLGRYIVENLIQAGHTCRCWHRPTSELTGPGLTGDGVEWFPGDLTDIGSMSSLVADCDAVVHAALYRPGKGFRGAEGDVATFTETNVVGTIRLIDAARAANVGRFVFISTCAVHEVIRDDRVLDEAHPLWPLTHYGAHKAAIEKFVHSYGLGGGYDICALRPTGIYGLAHPLENSKWYELVRSVKRGEALSSAIGGKEVHASDVAKAVAILLAADGVAGQAYNCYDMYISQQRVATIARELAGSTSKIEPLGKTPKHIIDTRKLRSLGMEFGGELLLRETVGELLEA